MPMSSEIKKQIPVALYSSLAVSVLTTTPVFMMTRISFEFYPWALVFTVLMAIGIWAVNIALFHFFRGRRTLRYGLSYIVSLFLALMMVHGTLFPRTGRFGSFNTGFYFHIILFVAVDTVLLIVQDLVLVRVQNAELRIRNVEAANLLLKQQVQPHFLFNSLSTLKSLIRFSPGDAEEYLVKLAGFLRSSIALHTSSVVTVEEELELCNDYLDMQRIRFGEALTFRITSDGKGFVPVFAVQGLIENAIKHNVLTKERPLWIDVLSTRVTIRVSNNLQLKGETTEGGTGLANLQERYRMLSGGKIVIEKSETEFSVTIPLLQNENRDHRG
jgi:hypothetical protein